MLAHKLSTTLGAYHAVEIMETAYARFSIPDIVNNDQGSQFTENEFVQKALSRYAKMSTDGR